MLRLNLACEPSWLDLVPGVRLRVAPLTSAILAEARASDTLEALVSDGADDAVLAVALAKELGARLILDWEGIGDERGDPLPVSVPAVAALLDLYPVFEAFQREFIGKALVLESEKNGSAPSPIGTSEGAQPTAPRARRNARNALGG